jgi:hypothetical protein
MNKVLIPVKTVKGTAAEKIFKGIESAELWKIFIEIMSEKRKMIKEKMTLAIKAIFIDEEITPLTLPSSFFPLKYAMYLVEPSWSPREEIVTKMLIKTNANE